MRFTDFISENFKWEVSLGGNGRETVAFDPAEDIIGDPKTIRQDNMEMSYTFVMDKSSGMLATMVSSNYGF